MPRLTRWSIRVAMAYLLAGLAGWAAYWADATWNLPGNWAAWRVISVHLITVGWLTQLIFAVMFWMFPIISRHNPYGDVRLGWVGFATLNVGLILRAVFEADRALPAEGLVISALLQWLGASAWVIVNWRRVKERGGR